jgi:aspartokinase-like uncharacterized kinase
MTGVCVLIVPGGGSAADRIRDLDRDLQLPAHQSHNAAIGAMSFNAGVLARTGGRLGLASDRRAAEMIWGRSMPAVLDVAEFLRGEGRTVYDGLPESWQVTSDSIAASISDFWKANRLILGKSCDPVSVNLAELSGAGMIDSWFLRIPGEFRVEWCNFRADCLYLQSLDRGRVLQD